MKMNKMKKNILYKLDLKHDVWDNTLCSFENRTSFNHTLFIIKSKDKSLLGSIVIDNTSYIGKDGNFEELGLIKELPEYFL